VRVGLAALAKQKEFAGPLLRGGFSACAPSAGSSPASAFENAAGAAATLCVAQRRTGRNIPAAYLPPAASARARNIPDSNIARSTLEAGAFSPHGVRSLCRFSWRRLFFFLGRTEKSMDLISARRRARYQLDSPSLPKKIRPRKTGGIVRPRF
jgi:hypothetical protein